MHKISVAEFVSWPERVDIPDFVESAPSLRRSDNSPPLYAQLYILDLSLAMQQRMNRNSNLCPDTGMGSLQELLKRYHSYAAIYKQAYEILLDVEDVKVRLRVMPGQDPRRPTQRGSDSYAFIVDLFYGHTPATPKADESPTKLGWVFLVYTTQCS
ncbi:hypothetical protein B0H19DRAFT_1277297 [Mycena capillaripes]|nr:hypothetical protein B0H19DRAFT_1277297 [Mycena capillaripes]